MDFGTLLYTAHRNDKSANKEVKCYKTKFEPPKKEVKTKTNLSANIQKYLQKRDEDEKRKADEEKRKKEELLALRSQDRKSFKRVQTMLKRTKSANKSVMEDAIDEVNTAVTMAGPQQCDEDDYGYVSQEASAFYAKLMDKYSSLPPEEPKFPQGKKPVVKDLNAAKDRVRAALQKEEEEEMMPHKRKRKPKSDKIDEDNEKDDTEKRSRERSPLEEPKKKKAKPLAPPPLDFSQLLKIAEEKQFQPIQIEKKIKEEDNERPMTKKQRMEYEREQERIRRRMEQENSMKDGARQREKQNNRIPKLSTSGERKDSVASLGRIPKKSSATDTFKSNSFTEKLRKLDTDNDSDDRHSNSSDRNKVTTDETRKYRQSDSCNGRSDHKVDKANYNRTIETVKRTDSFNSDSARKYSGDGQSRSNSQHNTYLSRNDTHSKRDEDRKNCQAEVNRTKNAYKSDKTPDSYSRNNERNQTKSIHSIIENKANFGKHSISEDEESEVSNSGHANSSDSYRSPPQYSKKRINLEKNGHHRDIRNDVRSDSQSGNHSELYKPTKFHSDSANHKNKPEMKYKQERENLHKHQSDKKKVSNDHRLAGNNKKRSPSPDYDRYSKKYRSSSYETNPELEYVPQKKQSLPVKTRKISSLFEGSDEEFNMSDYERYKTKKVSEHLKFRNLSDHEIKKSSEESTFQNYKRNEKRDFGKPKESMDKVRTTENQRSSCSTKSNFEKEVTKKDSSPNRSDNIQSISKQSSDTNKSLDKFKEKNSSSDSIKTYKPSDLSKKPNAEDIFKKSGNVWSKPCNLPPPKPTTPSGLSESQLERLRQMNKKPSPSLQGGRYVPMRPVNGRPSLLQAAKAAAAARASSGNKPSRQDDGDNRHTVSRPSSSNSPSLSKSKELDEKSPKSKQSSYDSKPRQSSLNYLKPKQFPPNDLKPKQFPPKDLKPKQFPPSDLKPRSVSSKDVQSRQFPPPDVKRKPVKTRRIEDSSEEDEHDSEMDDFIDDGTDMNNEQISQEIRSIFGYDKNKYLGMDDDDDECMESNFGQIDQEEYRSLKIGAQEDLIELMRDLAEKKRKQKRKMEMKKGQR